MSATTGKYVLVAAAFLIAACAKPKDVVSTGNPGGTTAPPAARDTSATGSVPPRVSDSAKPQPAPVDTAAERREKLRRATAEGSAVSGISGRFGGLGGLLGGMSRRNPGGTVGAANPAGDRTYKVPVYYGTNRRRAFESRGMQVSCGTSVGDLEVGTVYVSIPQSAHTTGVLERPRQFLGFQIEREDSSKHFTVTSLEPQTIEEWLHRVRAKVTGSTEKEALVYVHGFNTSFDDAALRAAQLAYDLRMDQEAAFMFSWPSAGSMRGYVSDEESVRLSRQDLGSFLNLVMDSTGATRVNIIAHSLGTRLVASVLEDLRGQPRRKLLGEVVFAAPDINAEEFRRVIAPRILGGMRLSVYTSTRDAALMLSRKAHSFARLGEGGRGIFRLAGFDKIDATRVDLEGIGHGYYADTRAAIDDIAALIRLHQGADRRIHLQRVQSYPTTWQLH
jgi:esterase/lipase superfamily enzyme